MRSTFSAIFTASAFLALFIVSSHLSLTVQALELSEDDTATQAGWDSSALLDDDSIVDYNDSAGSEVQPDARYERTRRDNKPDLTGVECQSGEVSNPKAQNSSHTF